MGNEVPISGIKKRAFLDEIVQGAKQSDALTLSEAIRAVKSSIGSQENFKRGKILVSTSGAGTSGSFELSVPGKEWTADNVFALCQQFLEALRDAVTAGTPDGTSAAEKDALYTAMVDDDRFRGQRSQMGDFSGLNFPATSLR